MCKANGKSQNMESFDFSLTFALGLEIKKLRLILSYAPVQSKFDICVKR